ncbi:DUF1998 domain-containing protein [Planomicrobium sp. Y74]|uniref:DUF1998 domain-containing protein n=1 Tax=Planomicrobium sp. Y74 TaxID=2478977 RepID=UPI000EF4B3ED|nr:DUF1998 domain-containing protein [Planomicrobium sp. Y74]RLQ90216.1 DUF1998 domain-containing protein [Planomicrobium sp. Y74]
MKQEVGEVRPGQLITTYGPGAIMDAVNDSLMILDIGFWHQNLEEIHDKRLASFLKKDYFKKIPVKGKKDLPSIPFPYSHICSDLKCREVFDIRKSFLMDSYLKYGPICPSCGKKSYPARFVVSCAEGNHLDDFPWHWWAHKRKGNHDCDGKLKLTSTGQNSGLSSMTVSCSKCGAYNDMGGATQKNSFEGMTCSGNHPHMLRRERCNSNQIIPLQRGASNVYFSVLRSAISIPESENLKQKIISENLDDISMFEDVMPETGVGNFFKKKIYPLGIFEDYEEFKKELQIHKKRKSDSAEETQQYEQIKEIEYEAFTNFKNQSDKGIHFKAQVQEVPVDLQKYFSRIVKADRLKEVLVLLGFTRIDSPEPEVKDVKNIVRLGGGNSNWLPAVEIFGEGIFIELNRITVEAWVKNNEEILRSSEIYKNLYEKHVESKGWSHQSEKDVIYVLLHTLSHLLIKQLSQESGYSSTAIKERIYYSENMTGILIYTGSTDQEGSLGGLVEMGEIPRLRKILINALDEAKFCSNDPSCSSQEPSEKSYLNGASCFACTMLPETACENGNILLSRSFLTETMESEAVPFFEGLI